MESLESRSRLRVAMPHVVTQWQADQYQNAERQQSSRLIKTSSGYLRSDSYITAHRKPNSIRQSPSVSLLAISPNERWDFGSIRHIRQYSTDENTPTSSVGSFSEQPSEYTFGSPNSSVPSCFIAELEDTSLSVPKIPARPRAPSSPIKPRTSETLSSTMEFKTSQITSRAVIKVVDETFAAIEDTNRQLLSRAMAAEKAAKRLQEQNSELQLQIKHYSERQVQPRPKTAPSQPSMNQRPRHRSATTPMSTFNQSMIDTLPSQPQTRADLSASNRPRHLSISPSTPLSRPTHLDLASSPCVTSTTNSNPSFHPSPNPQSDTSSSSPRHNAHSSHSQRHSHSHSHSHASSRHALQISPIIPGSVTRHEVTYAGTPLSSAPRAQIISLDEARRRAKPLPPLGPMSPSIVRGVVEIGGSERMGDWEVNGGDVGKERRKRGLSGLFSRLGKRESVF